MQSFNNFSKSAVTASWKDELTADCRRKIKRNISDQCDGAAWPSGLARAILPSVPPSRNAIIINPNPRKVGTEWILEARFPTGKIVAIRGFETEAAARQWLGSAQHLAWLREGGYSSA